MGEFYPRTHPRCRSHDYHLAGVYFVTTVTHRRRPIFGVPTPVGIALTNAGRIVHHAWSTVADQRQGVTIDAFVVMPDHVHAIVRLSETGSHTTSVSAVVGAAKQHASREIARLAKGPRPPIWQRSFHDSIIHDLHALPRIRRYIEQNPANAWSEYRRRARTHPLRRRD